MADLDLDAISQKWLQPCGSCDAGLPTACTHPSEDYRPVMLALVREVERLRHAADQYRQEAERLGEIANRLVRRASQERDRANEAARLSAEARDAADDLRKVIAEQGETVADLERQRLHRDAWAVRLCMENDLYPLPPDHAEDPYDVIAAVCRSYRKAGA